MPPHFFTDDTMDIADTAGARPGQQRMTDFAWLSQGKTLGKRTVLLAQAGAFQNVNSGVVDLFEVRGDDKDAMQLGVTLNPPQVLPTAGRTLPASPQDINGQMTNEVLLSSGTAFVWGRALARVDWGIGGVACSADMDFSNGLMINLQASWVRLRALFDDEIGAGITDAAYLLGAFIGPAHASPSRAQFTELAPGVANAGGLSQVIPIPAFARELQVLNVAPLATDDYQITFFRDVACAVPVGAIRYLGAAGTGPYFPPMNGKVMIPGDAYYCRIINNSAGAKGFNVVFDLAI